VRIAAICSMFIVTMGCDGGDNRANNSTGGFGGSSAGDALGVVFKNVNIVPMTSEAVLEGLSVYVSNGRIAAIDSFEALSPPDGTTIIDGTGKYLTPGFSDMHVHFFEPSLAQYLKLYLANGVTTVRNMWGIPAVLSARDALERGDILGPRIYTAGHLIDGPDSKVQGSLILDDVRDVEPAVTEMKEQGYDFIKIYDELSTDVYDEIIRVAKGISVPVVGHVPRSVGVSHAIQSGQFSIEHFTQYYLQNDSGLDEQIALTVESGIWNCPTLIVLNAYEDLDAARIRTKPLLKYVEPGELSSWTQASNTALNFPDRTELLHDLYSEGANIVSGTDAGNPYIIAGFSLHTEFELMQASGLTPYEVLLTTTVNAATMLGVEEQRGTVKPGKDADLVLLEDNPLENIKNTRSIVGVMIKGKWLPQEQLQSMLDEVEAR
jgi:imidazolonepropionase-like amidohydrolase